MSSFRRDEIRPGVIVDREEDMPPEALAELNRTLEESWDELEAGREISVADALRIIRAIR